VRSCLGGVAYVFLTNSHQASLLWLLVVYIAFFAVSQGAVIWVYIGEVFPNVVRNKGQSVGNSSHWIMNAAIALIFPILAAKSGGAPFVFFAVMTVVQFVTVLFFYPETKGQTLEALQAAAGEPKGVLTCFVFQCLVSWRLLDRQHSLHRVLPLKTVSRTHSSFRPLPGRVAQLQCMRSREAEQD
jgi:hypothetical protein